MIALVASALLGLYLLLPDLLFDRFTAPLTQLKRKTRTKTEEFGSALAVVLLPFALTLCLSWAVSWHVGNVPFRIENDTPQLKAADYQAVFMSMAGDSYLKEHETTAWPAAYRTVKRQTRFLIWFYFILFVEIFVVRYATNNYARFYKYRWFRSFFADSILKRASEWEVLLSGFGFDPAEKREVIVDVLTDDNHLYSGTVRNYFFTPAGELSGIYLKPARRFQREKFEAHRKADSKSLPDPEKFWKLIPGANFVIPANRICNVNFKYELPSDEVNRRLVAALNRLGLTKAKVLSGQSAAPRPRGNKK